MCAADLRRYLEHLGLDDVAATTITFELTPEGGSRTVVIIDERRGAWSATVTNQDQQLSS